MSAAQRVTRSMSRKRKLDELEQESKEQSNSEDPNKENNNNNANIKISVSKISDIAEPPTKKQKITTQIPQLDLKEYECPVCFELCDGVILQCNEGHLICNDCYPKLLDSSCPICKIKINKKIRNRMAEKALAIRIIDCNNKQNGCNQQIQFSQLNDHTANDCQYQIMECKYNILGCYWTGFRKDLMKHQKECNIDMDIIKHRFEVIKTVADITEFSEIMEVVEIDFTDHAQMNNIGDEQIFKSDQFRIKSELETCNFKIKIIQTDLDEYEMYSKLCCTDLQNNSNIELKIGILLDHYCGGNYSWLEPIQYRVHINNLLEKDWESEWHNWACSQSWEWPIDRCRFKVFCAWDPNNF